MLYFEISHLSKSLQQCVEFVQEKFSCVDQPSIAQESSFKRNHNINSYLGIKINLKKENLEKLSQFLKPFITMKENLFSYFFLKRNFPKDTIFLKYFH